MRLRKIKNIKKHTEVVGLFKKGYTATEISKQVGLTVKTVGEWIKPYRQAFENLERSKTVLLNRINEAIRDGGKHNEVQEMIKTYNQLQKL